MRKIIPWIYWILTLGFGAASLFLFIQSRSTMASHFTVDYSQTSTPLDGLSDLLFNLGIYSFALYSLLLLFKNKILKP